MSVGLSQLVEVSLAVSRRLWLCTWHTVTQPCVCELPKSDGLFRELTVNNEFVMRSQTS